MRRRDFLRALSLLAPATTALSAQAAGAAEDLLLRAMRDELERSRTLSLASLDRPYFIEYGLDDLESFSALATLGALIQSRALRVRLPRVRVRVGDYQFDNSNYVFSDYFSGTRLDPDQLTIDDHYGAIRAHFWLATDRAYKTAVEAIARKRAALKNVTLNAELPDFFKAQPVVKLRPIVRTKLDTKELIARAKELSAVFLSYPEVLNSSVSIDVNQSARYLLNSEGTSVRVPDPLALVQIRAQGQAPDGMPLRSAEVVVSQSYKDLPPMSQLRAIAQRVADHIRALTQAPVGETWSGPVLIEGEAAAQLIAELVGTHLAIQRRPVGEPGRTFTFPSSELEGRLGSRILPEFLSVIDDPTRAHFQGKPLAGHYEVDEEGVEPKPVTVIKAGRLESYLLTRQPVKGASASNGRARLPGAFGAYLAAYSNLIVESSESMPLAKLKARLLELCAQRNKPYGIIVRRMDFPSSASVEEVRRIAAAAAQSGSAGRPVSLPILAYRIYADGREELIRGVRFRGLSVRSLKDILAVSSDVTVFSFLNNSAPFALMGAASHVAPSSVVAPSLLFEDLELERPQEDLPKLSTVPPPPLDA